MKSFQMERNKLSEPSEILKILHPRVLFLRVPLVPNKQESRQIVK